MKHIYQLKIVLRDSDPAIWRRIQVAEDTTFSELHDIIQLSIGWEDAHLYEFTVNGVRIHDFEGAIDDRSNPSERDSMETDLSELLNIVKSRFTYVYDFGDHWEHVIQLEKVLPEGKNKQIPVCLGGEQACPPEDIGGIWRYQEILKILTDKQHPEYDDVAPWIGEGWNAGLFDCDDTNALLLDYAGQWEEIYEEMEEGESNDLEYEDWDDDYSGIGENSEYDDLKKFSTPEDLLLDKHERLDMQAFLTAARKDTQTIEYQTFERLRSLGVGEKKIKVLVFKSLAIEWFYEMKYGTDFLEERYHYNLNHLPETPKELRNFEDAVYVLDHCEKGVPFLAIEYLQNDPSEEAASAILKALRNHSDHLYCWEDCTTTPFWYALAAEGHLSEELIDPVIRLYEENINDSDWLYNQGQYLIGKLAQKYPDLTAQKVLEAMEKDADTNKISSIFYLFDVFYFCDAALYEQRLLQLLERNDLKWYDPLTATIADLDIKEALPILKERLRKKHADPDQQGRVIELEEAIEILEGKLVLDPDIIKPLSLQRKTSWQDDLKEHEYLFYVDDDINDEFGFPDYMDPDFMESINWPKLSIPKPFIKEKTPGRNDPCPCGSGRKYKKCCMDKDG